MTTQTEAPVQPNSGSGVSNGSAAQPPSEAAKPAAAAPDATKPVAPATTDQKGAGGDAKPGAEGTKPQESAKADVDLKFPEGVKLDEQLVATFKGWVKEQGIDGAKAQSLADVFTKHQTAREQAFQQQLTQQQAQWREQIQADKEIGGAQLEASRAAAVKAMDRFGGPELRQILEASGLGDHPAFVRAFAKVGKAISEDSVAGAASAGAKSGPEDALRMLYPSSFPKE